MPEQWPGSRHMLYARAHRYPADASGSCLCAALTLTSCIGVRPLGHAV